MLLAICDQTQNSSKLGNECYDVTQKIFVFVSCNVVAAFTVRFKKLPGLPQELNGAYTALDPPV